MNNRLILKWQDINENIYNLGVLYKEDNIYHFDINKEDLKKAIQNGCFGIGNMDLSKLSHTSKELFSFFKIRIPDLDNPNINDILKEYNLTEYDEMELLKATNGLLMTDRYFVD